jgi:hypothetical protein
MSLARGPTMAGKKEADDGGKIDGGAQGGVNHCLTGQLFSASGGGGVEIRFSGFWGDGGCGGELR